MKKKIYNKFNTFILVVGIILTFFTTNINYIYADKNRTITVGYVKTNNFLEFKNNEYSGYAYMYLREIAKYTGWEYKFVEMSPSESMETINNLDVDIIVGVVKNDLTTQIYEFPEYDIGHTYAILSTLKDNKSIDQKNYATLEKLRVGYFEKSNSKLEYFKEFCKKKNINNVELIPYPYEEGEDLLKVLESKEVDALITTDLIISDKEKVLAKYESTPHYFATKKGNKEIIGDINDAISKIIDTNPYFDKELYGEYFEQSKDYNFILTKEEIDYIENRSPLRAVYIENNIPTQYYDKNDKKPKGIYIDYVNLLAERSGLKINLIGAKNYEEAYKMIKDNKADLIVIITNEYSAADKRGITLTREYINIELVKVVRKDNINIIPSQNYKPVVAIPYGYEFDEFNKGYEIKYYNSFKDCIEAVRKGDADFTYGNEYNINYYLINGYYPDLTTVSNNIKKPASIGLAKPTDTTLLNIINKASNLISNDEIESIIYNNTIDIKQQLSLKDFFLANLNVFIPIIIFILSIISISIALVAKMKFDKEKEEREILFRKSQIEPLTGLYNREACDNLIEEYLENKELSLCSVFIIIDIDYFKQVNDNLGHKIGDKLLVEFAKLLEEIFSHKDIICRLGGDEFIVYMKDIDESNFDKVEQKLQELCELMDKEVEYNGSAQRISLSVGAVITKEKINFENLYHMADEMLYEVKYEGKNGFKIKNMING